MAALSRSDELDAVRVLTAHGSKGLEFDAVHFLEVRRASTNDVGESKSAPSRWRA